MLDKLRAQALTIIAAAGRCTLSTAGPAGLQASVVTCLVHDGCVYLMVPSTSDHLFNLEHVMEVALTTADWRLRGAGLVLSEGGGPRRSVSPELRERARAATQVLVEVFPVRMQLAAGAASPFPETIDFGVGA